MPEGLGDARRAGVGVIEFAYFERSAIQVESVTLYSRRMKREGEGNEPAFD